jgi:hypothetical protein
MTSIYRERMSYLTRVNRLMIEVVIGGEEEVLGCGMVGSVMYALWVIAVEMWFVGWKQARERTGNCPRLKL